MADLKKLFFELVRCETAVWNAVDARLRAEHGLPLSRFEPMQVIGSQTSCRVYDISETLSITTGGASKLVDAIAASGFCRRRPNPDDRRSSIIELTPEGKRLLARATRTLERELEERIGSLLSDRSLQQFTAALTRLRDAEAVKAGKLAA